MDCPIIIITGALILIGAFLITFMDTRSSKKSRRNSGYSSGTKSSDYYDADYWSDSSDSSDSGGGDD